MSVTASVGALALVASVLGGTAVLTSQQSAQAAPGNPGTPSAPTTVFAEPFENGVANTPVGLAAYTGATGQKYTADNVWLTSCNGQVRNMNTPYTTLGNCSNTAYTSNLGQLAWALGTHAGSATPAANHAVTAYTENTPGVNATEFQTVSNIPLASSSGRFLTFSVDTSAVNCFSLAASPQYQFAFLNQAGAATNVGGVINACSSGKTVTAPAYGTLAARDVNVGTYTSNGSLLFDGSSLGIRMQNANGSGTGNDAAFDNIRILDVTPQLDKAFSPTAVQTGGTSTLTFTVTNTSELASKSGWSFTDNLPAGLTLANSTVGGTCDADTAATAGGTSIAITNGNLTAGERSCTITVQVTSPTAGSFTNGPDNVTTVGLNEPGTSTVTFSDPSYTVSKTASTAVVHPGGTVDYTVTVKNTGDWAYTTQNPASFTDDLSKVLDDAQITGGPDNGATVTGNTLSWSGPLAAGGTQTIKYTVTVDSPDAGDGVLTNAVVPDGDSGGTCDPEDSCTTTTQVQSYSVVKKADTDEVVPGDTVNYTVTVKNTGQVDYTTANPASFTDDLSAVLDDATYNDDASSGATVSGNTLSWSGPLAVGDTATITYSVTVNDPITGDSHLDNSVVTPPNTGGDCVAGSDNPACTVLIPSGSFTVAKTASTTEVTAGDTVTYKVVVTNTGARDYTDAKPASFQDDLTRVLDDAQVTDGPDNGATVTGNTLSWSGPLAVGQSVTITYTITVDNPDTGDKVIANTVRATGPGGSCDPDADCSTTTNVRTFSIVKTSTPAGEVHPGDDVTYKVTVKNTGTAAFTTADPASFTDDLAKVTDDAAITDGPDNGATITGNTLAWSGPLDAGATITITYVATVNTPDTGDHVLSNAAVPGDGGYCDTEGGCSTTNPVGTYKIEKTSSANGVVHDGDTVTYTVTVTNTGKVAYTTGKPAKITDDLSKVLDDATYVNGSATNGATITGTTLTWSGPLAVDGTQTITYKVKVGPAGTGDGTLTNKVEGDPNTGGSCDPEADCTTTDVLQSLHVTKTADVTEVIPGAKVTYTVTVTNDGASAWTAAEPASFTDDLSNVLDDATYNGDASNGATYDAPTLSWSGPLAVDETATITYSVTVNDPDTGDKILDNTVVTPPGTSCAPGTDNPECSSIVPSGSFTVSKAADKDTVTPGDTITYTVTVKNTGKTAYTDTKPASFSDDLTNVLDDATYNKDASNGATVDGNTLTWAGPLKVGETVKITYSVTVNSPDIGNHRLVNAVVPTGDGGTCDTDGGCMTNTPVRSFTVTKTVSTTDAVKPGDKVGYTVTVKNTGAVAFTTAAPASFVDDMSDVLDDATYNGDATHGAKLTGTTLNWAGPLEVAQTIKVTYSVTVKAAGSGNGALVNTVDPPVDGSCDPDGACKTDTAITFPPGATPPGLAFTGTELVGPGTGLALMLLALGGTLLVVRRRRAHGDVQDNA